MSERTEEVIRILRSALSCDPILRATRGRQRLSKRKLIDSICSEEAEDRRPYDRSHFLLRLQTFSPRLWFAKPPLIAASQCALHGWRAVGPNRLGCKVCAATLTHDESLDPAGETLRERMASGHEEFCCWRAFSCPESFLMCPYEDEASMLTSLSQRINSFNACRDIESIEVGVAVPFQQSFPSMTKLILGTLSELRRLLESSSFQGLSLRPDLLSHPEGISPGMSPLAKSLYLSLCGWTFGAGELSCACCGRRFVAQTPKAAEEASPKRIQLKDGVCDHRSYCPWVGRPTEGLSCWEQCASLVETIAANYCSDNSSNSSTLSSEKMYTRIKQTLDMAASFGVTPYSAEVL